MSYKNALEMKWLNVFRKYHHENNMLILKHSRPSMKFEMSFRLDGLIIEDILGLINEDLGYEIQTWGIGKHIPIEKAYSKIRQIKHSDFFHTSQYFYDKNNIKRLVVAKVFPQINPGVLRIIWFGDLDQFNVDSFKKMLTHESFYSAFLYWEIDQIYQNTDRESVFKQKGLKYDFSKVFKTEWGYNGISIDDNPGRWRQICNMMLMSCFRMWFGPNSYELISKEKLETFSEGTVNKLVFDNIRFIELYEDPHLAFTKENRAIQKEFNEWIDIEGIYSYCLERFGIKLNVSDEVKNWNSGERYIE